MAKPILVKQPIVKAVVNVSEEIVEDAGRLLDDVDDAISNLELLKAKFTKACGIVERRITNLQTKRPHVEALAKLKVA